MTGTKPSCKSRAVEEQSSRQAVGRDRQKTSDQSGFAIKACIMSNLRKSNGVNGTANQFAGMLVFWRSAQLPNLRGLTWLSGLIM
jgi:hypothetical protein